MRNLLDKLAVKWKNYKFRFVPWVMFNMTNKTSRNFPVRINFTVPLFLLFYYIEGGG